MTVVPESSNPQGRRLDLPGQALAIASLGSLSLAAIEGPRWGWASTGSVAAFSLSVVAAALFLRRQAGATDAVDHAAPPRVCGLPCCGYRDELRRLRDAVPHP